MNLDRNKLPNPTLGREFVGALGGMNVTRRVAHKMGKAMNGPLEYEKCQRTRKRAAQIFGDEDGRNFAGN